MKIVITGNGANVTDVKQTSPITEGFNHTATSSNVVSSNRESLEAKFPGVIFNGDCSKIMVEEGVQLEAGVTIEQKNDSRIEIVGQSVLKKGAHVSTIDPSLESASFGENGQCSIRICDSVIGEHSEVCGGNIELTKMTLSDGCKVTSSGNISIKGAIITNSVHSSGSGDINIGLT